MRLVWKRDEGEAWCEGGRVFRITCHVRNEIDGGRRLHDPDDVVNTVREDGTWGAAYMPRPFPKGVWKITGVEKTAVPVFAPVKIKTDAHQRVEVWHLDELGGYKKPSGVFVEDYGYHLHWSEGSRTTLGCGRVGTNTSREVVMLAALVSEALGRGEGAVLEVV